MDGLFTVFGLGTAFGVFCCWMYDVIRKRNQPVSRGASFETFHGSNVMPAPEPVASSRPSEPAFCGELDPAPAAKPVELSLIGPYGLTETKASAPVDPLAFLAPSPAKVVLPDAAPVALTADVDFKPVVATPVVATSVAPKSEAPVVKAPMVNVQSTLVPSMKDTVVLGKTPAPKADKSAGPLVDTKDASPVAKPSEGKALAAAEDVVFTQADTDSLDVHFDVSDVSFVDTISFDPADFSLPNEPRAPRVVLLVNNTVVRDVQENDLLGLMLEFGILADSEDAGIFQRGDSVTVGRNTVQLVQT